MSSTINPSLSRILVIDDQLSIHKAFATILERAETHHSERLDFLEAELFQSTTRSIPNHSGFELEYAFSGESGLQKVQAALEDSNPFAVAFVDMQMPPGWDGLKTIEEIWRVDPSIQVVVCTAYSDYSWDQVLARLGRSDKLLLLKKPFSNEEVYQLAVALTEKWRLAKHQAEQLHQLQEMNARLAREVESRKSVESKLTQLAYIDSLTSLPNRFVLTECLDRSISKHHGSDDRLDALLFLDIDDFKLINDSLGHNCGDALLIKVATRLRELLRCYDPSESRCDPVAGRLGGDEFVVLVEDLRDAGGAMQVAKRISDVLSMPYEINGQHVVVGTSIGIATVDSSVRNAEEVFRNADIAMYYAKSKGKNGYALFDQAMHNAVVARLDMERDLRIAVENNQFELHFQPIVSLDSMTISVFEALIRWRKPDGRLVPPDLFIKIAEETGLIVPMGRWVIEEACRTLQRWQEAFPDHSNVSVSINVSKRQFAEEDFIDDVRSILRRHGVDGSKLHIEVTESVVMHSPAKVTEKLQELRNLGIQIHMDDFGTGHSSLSCLHHFPINVLKIDRSFISTMQADQGYASIVETIIVLSHNLGLKVTAEGIETREQLMQLKSFHCDDGQGYHFAKPMPADQIRLPFSLGSLTHVSAKTALLTHSASTPASGLSK